MTPVRDTARGRILAGAGTGLLLGLSDATIASSLATHGAGVVDRIAVLAVLPLLGIFLALVVDLFRGPLAAIPFAGVGYLIGVSAAAGRRAAEMPLADWWGVLLALGLGVASLSVRRAMASRPVLVRIGLVAAGLALAHAAGVLQRGRYHELREYTTYLAGGMVFAGLRHAMMRLAPARPRLGVATVVLIGSLGALGTLRIAVDQDVATWGRESGSAVSPWADRIRLHLGRADASDVEVELDNVAFFGTPLARDSRAPFLTDGRAPRGVLLITIDAWRGDARGTSLGGRPVTPHLDALAATGFEFTRAYAPSASSHMSVFGLFAGKYPSQILAHPEGLDDVPLITDRLESAGWRTRSVFSVAVHAVRSRQQEFTRLDMGFDEKTLHNFEDLPVDVTWNRVKPETKDERWFSYVHFMMPHQPYDQAPAEHRAGTSEKELWGAELRTVDANIAELLGLARRDGCLDDTLVIVTADHGEEFGEHGRTSHGGQLYEESIRVPLIVSGPGVKPGVWDRPVSLVDLAPTLEHLAGLPDEGRPLHAGRSWLAPMAGLDDPGRHDAVLCEIPPLGFRTGDVLSSVITKRWKLIVDEARHIDRLFDLDADPGEQINLATTEKARRDEERGRLKALRALLGTPVESVFRRVDDASMDLLERAEWMTPEEVDALLEEHHEADARTAARLVAWTSLSDERAAVRALELFGDRTDAEVVAALGIARIAWAGGGEDEVAKLCAWLPGSDDPILWALACRLMGVLEDPRLLEVPRPTTNEYNLVGELGKAIYESSLGRWTFDQRLVERGLFSDHQFVRRLAVELVGLNTQPERFASFLVYADKVQKSANLAAALTRTISRFDHPRVPDELRKRVFEGPVLQRRAALEEIVRRGDTIAGLDLSGEIEARVEGGRIEAPIKLHPGGTVLALFLELPPDAPEPRVKVSIGTWSASIEHERPDNWPTLLLVPAGTRGTKLTFDSTPGCALRYTITFAAPGD